MLRNTLFISLMLSSIGVQALDQQFISLKQTQFTPVFDNDGVFPSNSIDFDSSSFREIMYQSPDTKAFSIQVSGLLNADNEFDQVKALLDWGGIVMVASNGSVKGSFNQTDEARLPGFQDPDELFQTLLPSEQSFEGKSTFFGLGWEQGDGSISGIGYSKVVAPILLSVETNQEYTFGRNPANGEYENYHREGSYPSEAIDAEGTVEHFGLWIRLDPLKDSFETVEATRRPDAGFFFAAHALAGFAFYTPGTKVSEDYAYASEQVAASRGRPEGGTTLLVAESTSFISNQLTYGTGYQLTLPLESSIVGISVGVEGSLVVHLFEAEDEYSSGAKAELFSDSMGFSYGFFARVAASF
jgi:hypothetical protein